MPRLTVIGIGSPFADDRVGWRIVELLGASGQADAWGVHVVMTVCRSPGSELLSLLMNTDIAIIVDAVRCYGAPGTIYRMSEMESPLPKIRALSSHGLDLHAMRALAGSLGHIPEIMILYGIEAGPENGEALEMCQSVQRAADRVVENIWRDIAAFFPPS